MREFWVSLFFLLTLIRCGGLGESETNPRTLPRTPEKPSCDFNEIKNLAQRSVTANEVEATLQCAEAHLNSAFDQLKGSTSEEISREELRTLQRKKLIELPFESEEAWELAGLVFRLFHPEGREAVRKAWLNQLLGLLRKHQSLYLDLIHRKGPKDSTLRVMTYRDRAIDTVSDFTELLSDAFELSLTEAVRLTEDVRVVAESFELDAEWTAETANPKIEALWILKSLALADLNHQGVRANLTGRSLKNVIQMGLDVARKSPLTNRWALKKFLPQHIPSDLPGEWEEVGRKVQAYFSEQNFATVDAHELAWALNRLELPELADLSSDMVRISQRLAPSREFRNGLHPRGFSPLLSDARAIGTELVNSAPAFGVCSDIWKCDLSLREAIHHPRMKWIALKGRNHHPSNPLPSKRLDGFLDWEDVISRFAKRAVVTHVFVAFDQNGDGILPLNSAYDEDLTETFDLSYTFLRFMAAANRPDEDNKKKKEQRVPQLVMVKPGPLYKIMGLVGDRWMLDGNADGALNAEEFFSIVELYDEITQIASAGSYSNQAQAYVKVSDTVDSGWLPVQKRFHDRRDFIENLPNSFNYYLPYLTPVLRSLPLQRVHSLFHALIPFKMRHPIDVFPWDYNGVSKDAKQVTLRHYVKAEDALAPAAVLGIMDRLMYRCDADEDNNLNWKELDCAMPLILDAGHDTVSSALIDLDPVVNDGARILLKFLRMQGLPLTTSKLLAINGGIEKFDGDAFQPAMTAIDDTLSANWDDFAQFIGAPPSTDSQFLYWRLEAQKRFEVCDTSPQDGEILTQGEWDCVIQIVLDQIETAIERLLPTNVAPSAVAELRKTTQSEVFRMAIRLSIVSAQTVDNALTTSGIHSSPGKILLLLEEIIRRSVPLWQLPKVY